MIKYILTFIPVFVSDSFTTRNIVCRNYLTANLFNYSTEVSKTVVNDLMKLLKQDETSGRFTSSLYICHTIHDCTS